MNFNDNINIHRYSEDAKRQFGNMQERLERIEDGYRSRMNGKTTGGIAGSIAGTLLWLAVFVACAVFGRDMVNDDTILILALIIVSCLTLVMIIDDVTDYSYYGRISSYQNAVSRMRKKVGTGKNSLSSQQEAFARAGSKGWDYPLDAAASIPEEAISIETTMANMESLKKGFISQAKYFLYYASVLAVTVVGCIAFFPIGSSIITGVSEQSFSSDVLMAFNVIALIIVLIAEMILARLIWSNTDCEVTNTTLFILPIGPVAFLALILVVTIVVALVAFLLYIVFSIIAVILGIVCLLGITGGG